ncbi:hypothetical protein SAMN05444369_101142 [Capnocytophaga haemolytica]|jgi:hypothetical lipoprotein|uniref:Uncharacterized protein n=1 Tax=Capnocytophaga haemolytica TaxID=45243 RepID=A0AAX2GV45_9FLAO|nr:hypothetical protein [Capnocytophaga haemolytica]AMD85232.1 hypothetical protein AXF12_06735 [Capnocytophaga haemolytica]SFN63844.1 hypothetical protein SAMN05444369_101142 [Capnocytophaga haemolytica]SNV03991.1 Uncharacterised protein [Capnocytophaga haemolytica]
MMQKLYLLILILVFMGCWQQSIAQSLGKLKDSISCKETEIEMGLIEECTIRNTTISAVYQQIRKSDKIEKAHKLLAVLPKKDTEVKVSRGGGLIAVVYHIKKQGISIEMNYEGGVTTIDLLQQGNAVLRRITYSAD